MKSLVLNRKYYTDSMGIELSTSEQRVPSESRCEILPVRFGCLAEVALKSTNEAGVMPVADVVGNFFDLQICG